MNQSVWIFPFQESKWMRGTLLNRSASESIARRQCGSEPGSLKMCIFLCRIGQHAERQREYNIILWRVMKRATVKARQRRRHAIAACNRILFTSSFWPFRGDRHKAFVCLFCSSRRQPCSEITSTFVHQHASFDRPGVDPPAQVDHDITVATSQDRFSNLLTKI